MSYLDGNLTNLEYFRLHGTLSEERIIQLLTKDCENCEDCTDHEDDYYYESVIDDLQSRLESITSLAQEIISLSD